MSILSDQEIIALCDGPAPLLNPFHRDLVRKDECGQGIVSYGLSSYGYDVSIDPHFKIFIQKEAKILDPKAEQSGYFEDHEGDFCIIPPNSFALAHTTEYFRMPKDVTGLVTAKSTYARLGIYPLTTVLEAGWEGQLVLEFANPTPLPAKLYAREGAAQILFFRGNTPCIKPYDHQRKYQGQTGLTLARI